MHSQAAVTVGVTRFNLWKTRHSHAPIQHYIHFQVVATRIAVVKQLTERGYD